MKQVGQYLLDILQINLEGYIPSPDSDTSVTSKSANDRCFLAVNDRPVILKDLEKVIYNCLIPKVPKQQSCKRGLLEIQKVESGCP